MPILAPGASGAEAIEVRDLVAADGISSTVRPGEIFFGPNGSGKTTVTKILVTLLKPAADTARITGTDVTASPPEVRKVIGYAGQSTGIDDDLTAAENAAFHGILHGLSHAEAWQRAPELLAAFALGDVARQRAGRLSGALRRRLDRALALVQFRAQRYHDCLSFFTPGMVVLSMLSTGLQSGMALGFLLTLPCCSCPRPT